MFACLFQPSSQFTLFAMADRAAEAQPAVPNGGGPAMLDGLAREFSPRVQVHRDTLVSLDISGLGRLLGSPADIGDELKREAAHRGLLLHIAVAPTRTSALLLALARPGITVVPPGGERQAVAPLPLAILRQYPPELHGAGDRCQPVVDLLRRWGLRTLGDLADLPARPLSERMGQDGVIWRRLARGEDLQPLVATGAETPIEEALELEWPVEGLEPLSFVLARVCEPLSERLAAEDLAAVTLHLSCRLVSRETETRDLQLPAPMRDPRVLRTLLLLHLESHPLTGGVDRLALRVDVAPARITQFSLLARARPFPEQMATLLARLSALLGEDRVGAPALVDSYRPGAFAMARFSGGGRGEPAASDPAPRRAVGEIRPGFRRFRVPVPARVMAQAGKPVRVTTERRGLDGGSVVSIAGPWRTSGDWWRVAPAAHSCWRTGPPLSEATTPLPTQVSFGREEGSWNRDEWDVALADGGVYRIFRDRSRDRWFVDGIVD